ncbi:hypothetical protein [Yinghuangia soli]|uniref:Uncharacterized protein n=1 Tax=Yinghuangia soli TaxID=2908204 RepID=A0AA41TYF6_9ACTN|nr:hypothetical protein [Yinghuangia soli]MCF2526125.1 hypothetical protein [Yinghuangia soli]
MVSSEAAGSLASGCRESVSGVVDVESEGTWCVLIEQDDDIGDVDGVGGFDVYRWKLVAEHEARDEEHAVAWAEELLQTHLPSRRFRHGLWSHSRRIYQLGERSWLVAIQDGTHTRHFRLCVAKLVRTTSFVPPKRVVPPPPEKRRRRFFG